MVWWQAVARLQAALRWQASVRRQVMAQQLAAMIASVMRVMTAMWRQVAV